MGKTSVRKKKNTGTSANKLTDAVIKGIQEKKGHEIIQLDLKNTGNSVADYFIICHGNSANQVEAIAESVEETVEKKTKEVPFHKEGFENSQWIILDYFNVVVHIFQEDKRDYYKIEKLWADATQKIVASA
ncbi:MAG: ribosome silencing factor [Bacteroidia bacterium]|nr:ribosome silencing factor [Bacteroidia bacterium]MCZ2277099.1 ribosome silencing factor [Bacteroidia bacterium]